MDSFGLIPEISPGEISVVTSLIALLATAQAMGRHYDVFERAAIASNRFVIVAFFDGVCVILHLFPDRERNDSDFIFRSHSTTSEVAMSRTISSKILLLLDETEQFDVFL